MIGLRLVVALLLIIGSSSQVSAQSWTQIENAALVASEESRQRLKYLVSCALDEGTGLQGNYGGETYKFPGGMGLAPHWNESALSLSERRWVSACILARTNAFGERIQISLRADAPFASLQSTPQEMASHSLYEGGFFGDLFAEDAAAFVCVGARHSDGVAARAKRRRVCSDTVEDGTLRTQCGFIQVGTCPQDAPPLVEGQAWPEVIHVWLAGNDRP